MCVRKHQLTPGCCSASRLEACFAQREGVFLALCPSLPFLLLSPSPLSPSSLSLPPPPPSLSPCVVSLLFTSERSTQLEASRILFLKSILTCSVAQFPHTVPSPKVYHTHTHTQGGPASPPSTTHTHTPATHLNSTG